MSPLSFEKPVADLEAKIAELRQVASADMNIADEMERMQAKADRLLAGIYASLTPAQKVLVARHEARPHTSDYIRTLFSEFTSLSGDRLFGEDAAMLSGLARFEGRPCVVLGQERGHDTQTRIKHNFGMAKPEGYRKAQRLAELAARFSLPIITFVDTAGAYPGVGAEERGQSEAIARSMQVFLTTPVPIITIVIGEGGSGGAIAIACADRVYMLEHAIYSVISPEGCASILWRSAAQAPEAAAALRLTAQDLHRLGLIDGIISEPVGGAHRHRDHMIQAVGRQIGRAFSTLTPWDGPLLLQRRKQIFLTRAGGDI